MKKALYFMAFIAVSFAYGQDFSGSINSYLNSNQEQLGLQTQDFADIKVDRNSYSKSMDVENVYVIQRHQGIEIFNSNSSFAVKNGTVVYSALSFSGNIAQKVNTTNPGITASIAVNKAAQELGLNSPSNLQLVETVDVNSFIYSNGNVSLENIPVKLVYQKMEDNSLRLAWDLSIYLLDASHYYSVRIDATNGTLLETLDWVTSCNFGEHSDVNYSAKKKNSILFPQKEAINVAVGANQYRVFAMPLESPDQGSDTLIDDPSGDGAGSPFGWHDTNGAVGAEFTITRGNNVWAQDDVNDNNANDGISADGGATLDFDFPYDLNNPPFNMIEAITVNLFYWNNIMHDVWYEYGFDEESGNFQENNYGNGGDGSDSVNADAQDGSGLNNANFATPPDGSNPRMQMYLFEPPFKLIINNGPLAGEYNAQPADFGGAMPLPPGLTEDLVLVEDDDSGVSTDPNDACDPITNGSSLSGKIAVIRRGECEFGFKVLAAETEGAIAVIVVNNVEGPLVTMSGGAVGASVTIPAIFVSLPDGEAIIAEISGNTVNATIVDDPNALLIDGDLDNGIIAHEYGHGISRRLTGGPNTTSCSGNVEDMGEGWSDWYGLMLTMKNGDQGDDVRWTGTYATGTGESGPGIRSAAYSTDMSVNSLTYADLPATGGQTHAVGTIWATVIWDLTWALVDEYGFDDDFYHGTGGNNMAMQLVIDGLKLQPCGPGFVTGRDAILEADELINGGANRCLIWEVFARRGLGVDASQGNANSESDGVVNFDIPTGPDCEGILSVNDNELKSNFIIYPNPSNGNINIRSLRDFGDASISIFDINGRLVFNQEVNLYDTVNINAEKLTTGLYLIQIDGVDYSHTAKLIIN